MTLLNELCQTCGKLALTRDDRRKSRKKYNCSDYAFQIHSVFGIDILADNNTKHSAYICRICVTRIKNITDRKSTSAMTVEHNDAVKLSGI